MTSNSQDPVLVDAASNSGARRQRRTPLLVRSLRLWRTRIGLSLLMVLVGIAILGPFLAPHGPAEFVALPYSPPGGDAGVLGTDYLGQDVLSRFLYGGRSILGMAITATAIGVVVGICIGLVAAYARNVVDNILMRGIDVIMAFPSILLALLAMTLLGPKTAVVIGAVALSTAPGVARVSRGTAQPVVERDFVAAAQAMGLSRFRILSGEVLPNTLGPLLVEASLRLTWAIGTIATLAYLGFSSDPNGANWGTMVQQNQIALTTQPWAALVPIIAIGVLTLGTGLIGDGIARTAAGIDRQVGEE